MISADEALDRLKAGNLRYVEGNTHYAELVNEQRRSKLLDGQLPWAVVLGCSTNKHDTHSNC